MDQFYSYVVVDDQTGKRVKGVAKGPNILEIVRSLAVRYKQIDSIQLDRLPSGVMFFETDITHVKKERKEEPNVQQN